MNLLETLKLSKESKAKSQRIVLVSFVDTLCMLCCEYNSEEEA